MSVILFFFSANAQNIIKRTETVRLQQLSIINPDLLINMEKLSQPTESPLFFEMKTDDIYYLDIQITGNSVFLLVFREEHFLNLDNTIGFFEHKQNTFIIVGDYISKWFSKTDSFRNFNYVSFIGRSMKDGRILPLIMAEIDDSRIALLYEYSDGILKLKKIIHGF